MFLLLKMPSSSCYTPLNFMSHQARLMSTYLAFKKGVVEVGKGGGGGKGHICNSVNNKNK